MLKLDINYYQVKPLVAGMGFIILIHWLKGPSWQWSKLGRLLPWLSATPSQPNTKTLLMKIVHN